MTSHKWHAVVKIGEPHEPMLLSLSSSHCRAHRLRNVLHVPSNAWFIVRLTRQSDAALVWMLFGVEDGGWES
jgi:hypothetical protein